MKFEMQWDFSGEDGKYNASKYLLSAMLSFVNIEINKKSLSNLKNIGSLAAYMPLFCYSTFLIQVCYHAWKLNFA